MKKSLLIFALIFSLTFVWSMDMEKSFGLFHFKLYEKPGTFSLSIIDSATGKITPVLSTADNSSGTRSFLQVGTKTYPLMPRSGVTVEQAFTDVDVRMEYSVKDKFIVSAKYSFMPSVELGVNDIMRVQYTVKNTSNIMTNFTLKQVFDTCLGETTAIHFSTATKVSVNQERVFYDMKTDKWIRSSNGKVAVQFLLEGADVTTPKYTVLANKDVLLSHDLSPNFKEGRRFNSFFSYNNSALGLLWEAVTLEKGYGYTLVFYISANSNEQLPADMSYDYFVRKFGIETFAGDLSNADDSFGYVQKKIEPSKIEVMPEPIKEEVPELEIDFVQEDIIIKEKPVEKTIKTTVEKPAEIKQPTEMKKTQEVPLEEIEHNVPQESNETAEEYKKRLLEEQTRRFYEMNKAYIQSLIDRIEELEKDSSKASKEEIEKLNKELDAIFERMQ
ncbi:MAG: hypothetical protein GX220_02270 [Treponema sp.]|nr:hypothetical protein [Treponema sp.]